MSTLTVFGIWLTISTPAVARRLTVLDWQARAYRVLHQDEKGSYTDDSNYAYLIYDDQVVVNGVRTGYYRALQANNAAAAQGKPPLFCPPPDPVAIWPRELSAYFDTLPLAYRKKTSMIDAMLGFVIQKFPCPAPKSP